MANGQTMAGAAKTPVKTISAMLNNEAVIAVASASILAPIVVPTINNYVNTLPVLKDHKSLSTFFVAILLFGLAQGTKQKKLSALIIGIAGTFLITGLMPIISPLISRVKN